jgi:hypothetical protein
MIRKAEILHSAPAEATYKNTVGALKGQYKDYKLEEA